MKLALPVFVFQIRSRAALGRWTPPRPLDDLVEIFEAMEAAGLPHAFVESAEIVRIGFLDRIANAGVIGHPFIPGNPVVRGQRRLRNLCDDARLRQKIRTCGFRHAFGSVDARCRILDRHRLRSGFLFVDLDSPEAW